MASSSASSRSCSRCCGSFILAIIAAIALVPVGHCSSDDLPYFTSSLESIVVARPHLDGSVLTELNCEVEPADSVLDVRWYKDGVFLSDANSSLLEVTETGVYQCHVDTNSSTAVLVSQNATVTYYDVARFAASLVSARVPVPFILGSTLARLNCSVTPEDAVLNRLWFKDNVLLATGTPVLNVEQAGVYRCHVLTTDGTLNSDNATISYIPVDSSIRFDVSPQSLVLEKPFVGQSLGQPTLTTLSCVVKPIDQVLGTVWYVDNVLDPLKNDSDTFRVMKNGTYSCRVLTKGGVLVSDDAVISYLDTNVVPYFTSSPRSAVVKKPHRAGPIISQLSCQVEPQHMVIRVRWYKDDKLQAAVDTNSSLNVVENGTYHCRVETKHGTIRSFPAVISYADPVVTISILNTRGTAFLRCVDGQGRTVADTDDYKVVWKRKAVTEHGMRVVNDRKHRVFPQTGLLQIRNVGPLDSGEFRCIRSFSSTSHIHSSWTRIEFQELSGTTPDVVSGTVHVEAVEGSTARFECLVALPKNVTEQSVSWKHKGYDVDDVLTQQVSTHLLLSHVMEEAKGQYSCYYNGTVLSTVNLDVRQQPTFGNVIRDNVAETVDIGSEVPFSGSLIPPTLTGLHLYHNGELAKEDDIVSFTLLPWFVQLSIRNMSSQTAGIYQIIGHNDYGYEQIVLLYVLNSFTVRNLSAMVVDSHTVHLSWVPPDTAGDVAWYRITWRSQARTRRQRRQSTGVRDRVKSQVVPGNATSANISVDLSRGHVEFSVQASHESGLAGDMVNIVPRGQAPLIHQFKATSRTAGTLLFTPSLADVRSAFQLILHFGEGLQAPLHIAADEVQCNTEFSSCSVAVSAAQASSLGTLDMSQAQSLQLHAVNTGARALSASFAIPRVLVPVPITSSAEDVSSTRIDVTSSTDTTSISNEQPVTTTFPSTTDDDSDDTKAGGLSSLFLIIIAACGGGVLFIIILMVVCCCCGCCCCNSKSSRKTSDSELAARKQSQEREEAMKELESPLPVEVHNPLSARNPSLPNIDNDDDDMFVETGLGEKMAYTSGNDLSVSYQPGSDLPPPPLFNELEDDNPSLKLHPIEMMTSLPPPSPPLPPPPQVSESFELPTYTPGPQVDEIPPSVDITAATPTVGGPPPPPPPPPPLPVGGIPAPAWRQQNGEASSSGTNDSGRFSVRSADVNSEFGSRASRGSRRSMPALTPDDLKGALKRNRQRPPIPKPMRGDASVVVRPSLRSIPRPSSMQLDMEKDKQQQMEATGGTPKSETIRSTSSALSTSSNVSDKLLLALSQRQGSVRSVSSNMSNSSDKHPPPVAPKGSVRSTKSRKSMTPPPAATPPGPPENTALSYSASKRSSSLVSSNCPSSTSFGDGAKEGMGAATAFNASAVSLSSESNQTSSNGTLGDKSTASEQLSIDSSMHNGSTSNGLAKTFTTSTLPLPQKSYDSAEIRAETLDRSPRSKATDSNPVERKSASEPSDLQTLDGIENLSSMFDNDIDAILHQLEERRDTLTKQLLELNVNDSSADGDAHSAMTNGVNGSEPEPAFSAIDRNDKKPVA